MKKLFAVVLCFAMVTLAGCRSGGTRVAFLIYDGSDTFITEMMNKMVAVTPDNLSYEIRDAGNSQIVQNQQIIEMMDCDLLVINAVDRLACGAIVEKCASEGIQVIFFNREPLEDALQSDNVYYVGADADSLGEKQANMVAELFGSNFAQNQYDKNGDGVVQLVILKGEQGHQDAEKRTENCVSRMKELGYVVEILAVEVANWTRQEGYDSMKALYGEFGDGIELVFSNNDDMALGAIDYMLEIGEFSPSASYDQPFVIVGVDGTTVGLEAIQQGLLYGTVHNDSTSQSDAIMTLMTFLLDGRDLAEFPYEITNGRYIYIDGAIILKDNLADYII